MVAVDLHLSRSVGFSGARLDDDRRELAYWTDGEAMAAYGDSAETIRVVALLFVQQRSMNQADWRRCLLDRVCVAGLEG